MGLVAKGGKVLSLLILSVFVFSTLSHAQDKSERRKIRKQANRIIKKKVNPRIENMEQSLNELSLNIAGQQGLLQGMAVQNEALSSVIQGIALELGITIDVNIPNVDPTIPQIEVVTGDDGVHCWDLNEDSVANLPDEDTNLDGFVDVLDCKGEEGSQGEAGPQGLRGAVGPQGAPGTEGVPGPQGIQGVAGAPGPRGEMGPAGPQGDTGVAGPQGIQGLDGPMGLSGASGEDGIHCWDLNENGIADLPEEDKNSDETVDVLDCVGPSGEQGLQGETGEVGPIGPQGVAGTQGERGERGIPGAAGAQGERGPQGVQGVPGSQGPMGPQGPAGIIADNSVASVHILNNSIRSEDVLNNSLTAADLAPDSVGASELAANSVRSGEIADDSITHYDLAHGTIRSENVNQSQIQLRVANSCPANTTMSGINADGSVVCRPSNECKLVTSSFCPGTPGTPVGWHPSCPAGWVDKGGFDPMASTGVDWCRRAATLCCR